MTQLVDGAVPAPGIDAPVAWHYGDPLREQRLLTTGAGLVDRSHRDVLTVGGPERLGWLHSIISQHVAELVDGQATETLVLSPHGHVEQHWQLVELGGTVWIDTEPGAAAEVLGYLQKMRFLKRVEPADVSADWALLSLVGPKVDEVLAAAGLPSPGPGLAVGLPGGGFARAMAWPGPGGVDLLVPREARADYVRRLTLAGSEPAGIWAYEALRIEARRPRLGFETDHRTIPHEVGWIGEAVHLNKGCYRGQETVARVHNLGKPPRRLVLLYLGGESDVLPEPGTAVELDGRTIGFVGTAAHHHEMGPIALAVLKRSVTGESHVTVGGEPVGIDG
ncbi:folate-binding protein [Jatrophihabitans sp.]|uniref:CAF17-like 4Fe-4S cluster assembly/insertion protein YgfZ n=1 Tax=Jatrophihabitans sp. TaxID=1932789 RepID=UPI0030C769F9|nr:folate-binding protein YgfZ [Jatrophihabitans sp.]